MIDTYLQQLGLSNHDVKLYLTLLDLGMQPASVVARKLDEDRVTTYKHLKKLAERGLVEVDYNEGMQCFRPAPFEVLRQQVKEQNDQYARMLEDFPMVESMLRARHGEEAQTPRLEVYEGGAGVRRMFRDILFSLKKDDVHQIRMLTSNTFEERLGDVSMATYVEDFFRDVREREVDVEILEASGTLIPERLERVTFQAFNPANLPAARGTTSIFVVGHSVYLTCYKSTQIGMKITQAEIAQIFHFVFDLIGRSAQPA